VRQTAEQASTKKERKNPRNNVLDMGNLCLPSVKKTRKSLVWGKTKFSQPVPNRRPEGDHGDEDVEAEMPAVRGNDRIPFVKKNYK